MIPVTEFRQFSEQQPAFRVLKPWWDVFMDYLSAAMLMIGGFGCTLQIMPVKILCLPERLQAVYNSSDNNTFHSMANNLSASAPNPTASATAEIKGLKTNLDIQQYNFINYMCYELAIPWYTKYFPYLVLLHTLFFMICSNFWFKYPESCSKIELFISVLWKCFDSPWTTRALCIVSGEEPKEKHSKKNNVSKPNISQPVTETPLLKPVAETSIVDKAAARDLDEKEREQAKALFEKVKKIRYHVEGSIILIVIYVNQTILKLLHSLFLIGYNGALVSEIQFTVDCEVDIEDVTGYNNFYCNLPMAPLFSKMSFFYLCLVGVYGLCCLYTLYWLLHRSLKQYSFEYVRVETGINDIPDVKNDLAFLFHMIDQYDPLYSKRFAVFLSEASENKLKQLNLNNEWTVEKLRLKLQTNASNRLELHLLKLPGLPDTVFEITELQSLKLESIPNVMIPAAIAQLNNLQELSLWTCPAKIHSAALAFLKENVHSLSVKFVGSPHIPQWMCDLGSLEELNLTGLFTPEISKHFPNYSFKKLKSLKHLVINSNLTSIPQYAVDISAQLQKLSIDNNEIKLVTRNSLKNMANLMTLELVNCKLDQIPNSIFSLLALKELDLKNNNLKSIQEIASFQNLQKLSILKLWHNSITKIPDHISKLANLEQLYISHNNIGDLPHDLFLCCKLRHLELSNNNIRSIPHIIRNLSNLKYFSVSYNRIETIPDELYFCQKLETLNLRHNNINTLSPNIGNLAQLSCLDVKENPIGSLPLELGSCQALKRNGLSVEDRLFETLPFDIRDKMTKEQMT
ncbi:hypothetical protein XENTR_v10012181 [Xenopus tropicalis]|uniref:Provisional ortholog of leucine-rich repeat-containing 8 VRAC subunit C n=1 Tax=Xenopus tropicalis TaxID=8364 RepID=F7DSB0_XENTR|nr:uncharacterized protein LOC100170560 isoform X1 [Xenopus tropicalis]KAE8610611.1 hypothetical protein XENTR_v10012181 [Xenopus tropicalis]KAE8610612.1 hypothetical protein XENTR_v10012181 [Xenopus tropicalis]